jgi:hypothetical protein
MSDRVSYDKQEERRTYQVALVQVASDVGEMLEDLEVFALQQLLHLVAVEHHVKPELRNALHLVQSRGNHLLQLLN